MKLIVPFSLLIAIGCILTVGCLAVANKNTVNDTMKSTANISVAAGFVPFNTSHTGPDTNVNETGVLKGPLRVTISGYPANLDVILDTVTVGTVKSSTDLNLMVSEGNHSVMVCINSVCEQENITASFGRQVTVDFGERLRRDVQFPTATARIIDYAKNGNGVSVNVEFINPETVDHTISVELGVGYTYIDGRTFTKHGDFAKVTTPLFVPAGQRVTRTVDIAFEGSGTNYCFDYPVISELYVM